LSAGWSSNSRARSKWMMGVGGSKWTLVTGKIRGRTLKWGLSNTGLRSDYSYLVRPISTATITTKIIQHKVQTTQGPARRQVPFQDQRHNHTTTDMTKRPLKANIQGALIWKFFMPNTKSFSQIDI
jgi:hypothetical protein